MKNQWTKEEDERLLALISENVGNLSKAFHLFKEEYPTRTLSAIQTRWYTVLRPDNNTRVCFATAKKHRVSIKPSAVDFTSEKVKKGIWGRVLKFIFRK